MPGAIDNTGTALQTDGAPVVIPDPNNTPGIIATKPKPVVAPSQTGQNAPLAGVGSNTSTMPTTQAQAALGLKTDGVYGPITTAAVKAFQQQNGLTPDGILGPVTMAALQKVSQGTSSTALNTDTKVPPPPADTGTSTTGTSGGTGTSGQKTVLSTTTNADGSKTVNYSDNTSENFGADGTSQGISQTGNQGTGDPVLDSYVAEIDNYSKSAMDSYAQYQASVASLQTGALQLAPEDQQYISAIQASTASAVQMATASLQAINASVASQVAVTQKDLARSGATMTSPSAAASQVALTAQAGQIAVQSAVANISSIQNQGALAIAQYESNIRSGQISAARQNYEDFQALQDKNQQAYQDLAKTVMDHQQQVTENNLAFQSAQLDQQKEQDQVKQMQETARHDQAEEKNAQAQTNLDAISKEIEEKTFNATYGAFVDANGNPSTTSPSSLPGYTSLPNGTAVIDASKLPTGIKASSIGGIPVVDPKDIPIISSASTLSTLLNAIQSQYTGNSSFLGLEKDNPTLSSNIKSFDSQLSALSKNPTFSGLSGLSISGINNPFKGNVSANMMAIRTAINNGLSTTIPGYTPPSYGEVFTNPSDAQSYFSSTGQTDEYNSEVSKANTLAQQLYGRDANDGEILQIINGQ